MEKDGSREDILREKLRTLPSQPGVYLMKNRKGGVLYVGKALSLRGRVRSYFRDRATLSRRIEAMTRHVDDIEWIVTGSDLEALILENNLIKKHRPRYNIILRDDKNYPFIRLDIGNKFPRIQVVRRIFQDGALYFGPYVPVGAMRETLKVIKRIFPLATCKLDLDRKYERPCIEYEIGRCAGPCVDAVSEEEYHKIVRDVRLFLEGRDRELLRVMRQRMHQKAVNLEFEEAAQIRNRIFGIEKVLEKQRIISAEIRDTDVVGIARSGTKADLQILFFRGGMLVGRKDIFYDKADDVSDEELVLSFIEQFYSRDILIPADIILPFRLPEAELMKEWLSVKKKARVSITVPKRGRKRGMLMLAMENAQQAIRGHDKKSDETEKSLEELRQLADIAVVPDRIEAFDISNILGAEAVGSLVVWEKGIFKKDEYRHFKIRDVGGADDFAMMGEVVRRCYSRRLTEESVLPDLVVIDGGRGQLNAALAVLDDLGIKNIGILGLAKASDIKGERIFLPEKPDSIELAPRSAATHILQRIRDEAHRFAISHHRKVRGKESMLSDLDRIKGIGRARKIALLKYFGSVEALKKASIDDLVKAPGINRKVAGEIIRELGG